MLSKYDKHKLIKTLTNTDQLIKQIKSLTNTDQLIKQQLEKQLMKLIQYEQTQSKNKLKVRTYDKPIRFVDLDKNRSKFNQPYQVRYNKQLLNVLLGSNDQK